VLRRHFPIHPSPGGKAQAANAPACPGRRQEILETQGAEFQIGMSDPLN
jgi:hypothetical protein